MADPTLKPRERKRIIETHQEALDDATAVAFPANVALVRTHRQKLFELFGR